MASRKQRKRRQKEKRHEYELVLVDETGEERPIDSEELRAKRQEKEAQRKGDRKSGGKGQPARGARSRGPVREVQPPSFHRVWKRVAFFAAFMFLVLNFLGKGNWPANTALALIYSALFVPFIYLMDRVQYRQYLRKTGQEDPSKSGRGGRAGGSGSTKPASPDAGSGPKAFGAGLFRGRRR